MFLIPLLTIVVFGYEEVMEPPYTVLLNRTESVTYEVRSYDNRFVIESEYESNTSSPFMKLAAYIGVRSHP